MKTIPLKKGNYVIIDDDIYKKFSRLNLLNRGKYAYINIDGGKKYVHRLIMNAKKGQEVDHINGNTLDNRISNLRLCTHSDNLANQKVRITSKTGFRGVSPIGPKQKRLQKYEVHIRKNGKQMFIGRYINPKEGAIAYNKKAKEIFGEFARLNKIS